jgi:hypothetical protein
MHVLNDEGNQRMFKQLLLCLGVFFLCRGHRHRGKISLGKPELNSKVLSIKILI